MTPRTLKHPRIPARPLPLLQAKLSQPRAAADVLARPHLLAALGEHAARSLLLVVADAGFGKTTLVASFARSMRRPVVWYSLMPSDADLMVFGRYLLEGFRREAPRIGRDYERAIEEARPSPRAAETLAGIFSNELAGLKGPPWLLVLDDFHEVASSPSVTAFVETLLRHLPATVRLAIASRTPPSIALERLRARGEIFELSSAQMRFSREELARLFAEVYRRPLSEPDLAALEETTLGWPTAVHLVHESLRRSADVTLREVLENFRASNLELQDYLSSEVFTRLDPDSRRTLERTAALTRFDAGLSATLSDVRQPRAVLDALTRRGLLRAYAHGPQTSYECHDLVRRFLRQGIEQQGGAEAWRTLEAETASALAARGEPERALRHYLQAGAPPAAAALLRELAPTLLRQGRAAALLEYLADLPAAGVQRDAALALALADAHQALGHWDEAESLYPAAMERCRALADRAGECRALLGLGKVLNMRGRYEQVLGMAERGLAMSQGLEVEIRVRLLQMKAAAHHYLGQHQAAVQILDQVREQLRDGTHADLLVPTVHNLAVAYAEQGRFHEAAEELRAALAQVRGASSPRAPLYLSNLAFLLAYLGELGEARRAAEEGLVAAQRFSNRAQETTCQEALAQILAQGGDADGALAALKRAEELNAELRMEMITADLLAVRGRIFCARGQYRRAVEFLEQAIARFRDRPDAPALTEYTATLAWCELRAGRVRVARDLLRALCARADAGENDYQRMRIHYWLAETELALGENREVAPHLTLALRLVRERDYLYFLKVQAREEPAPLLHALGQGLEVGVTAAALVEAGAAVEAPLLSLLERANPAVGEAALSVLAEVGGETTRDRLPALSRARRALAPAVAATLRHVSARTGRGARSRAPAASARLVLFGPPRLLVDDRPVPASAWRAQRAFHLLLYLALHPRGADRDQLLEIFWPGRQLAAGRRNFHPTLSYIRSVLPQASAPPILRESSLYRLHPDYALTCDAWELERGLEEARHARDAESKRKALERCAALASAGFLEGVYGGWADEIQARMRERVEKLLLELGDSCAKASRFEDALQHLRRAAELDEYREATRLMLIECLMRTGDRRGALVEYERLRTLLRRELQVEPLPETDDGIKRLLAGEGVHGWPGRLPRTSAESDASQPIATSTQARIKATVSGSSR